MYIPCILPFIHLLLHNWSQRGFTVSSSLRELHLVFHIHWQTNNSPCVNKQLRPVSLDKIYKQIWTYKENKYYSFTRSEFSVQYSEYTMWCLKRYHHYHLSSSFVLIICPHHLFLSFVLIICPYHMSSSIVLIICLYHMSSLFVLIICPHHLSS